MYVLCLDVVALVGVEEFHGDVVGVFARLEQTREKVF